MRMPMSIAKCNATLLAWKVELARWRAYQNHRYQHVGAPPNFTFQAVATSLTASLLQQSSSKHAALVWCGLNLFIQKCVGLLAGSRQDHAAVRDGPARLLRLALMDLLGVWSLCACVSQLDTRRSTRRCN